MHTYMHTYIHTYIHTYVHTYIHTYIYVYTSCIYVHTQLYIHEYRLRCSRSHEAKGLGKLNFRGAGARKLEDGMCEADDGVLGFCEGAGFLGLGFRVFR